MSDIDPEHQYHQLLVKDQQSQEIFALLLKPMEVIAHRGDLSGGHYFTYTQEDDGQWLLHDDKSVKPGSPNGQKPTLVNFSVIGMEKLSE